MANEQTRSSAWGPVAQPWARLALIALAITWYASGWAILTAGLYGNAPLGFAHKTGHMNGAAALFMSMLFFTLSLIAVTIVVRSTLQGRHIARLVTQLCWIAMLGPVVFSKI